MQMRTFLYNMTVKLLTGDIKTQNKAFGIRPGPKIIKLFSCSAHLLLKFILLKNVKMPTIVGILTYMSRFDLNVKVVNLGYFVIYELFKFYAQLN